MKISVFAGLICLLVASSALAQGGKQWSDWSKREVDKMLNDSAWAQSFKKGEDQPVMTSRSGGSGNQGQGIQGPAPEPTEVNVRVRLITAKPIREGFANRVLKGQSSPPPDLAGKLQTAIDNGFGDFIVVAVNVDGPNPRTVGATLQALMRLKAEDLEDKVYLERKDGKRLQLLEYKTPIADDMGGKFVFARTLDGSPFLGPSSENVRFVLNQPGNLRLNVRFDVSKMTYNGNLEY
ncbi:MAG TPA: hypothetical protein PKD26_01195 [Pyrinomonadaceae bacterium]|nr:hypothetical protein [Pyrinomonadaceae bacterium]